MTNEYEALGKELLSTLNNIKVVWGGLESNFDAWTAVEQFAEKLQSAAYAEGRKDEADENAWRPISTAPKDEVVMLSAEFDRPGDWRMKCGYFTEETGWHVWGASWRPTMWRPMPSKPKGQS